jgi:hypothetical protein
MLLPNDALIGWGMIAVPTALAVWRWPRNRVTWLGLAIAAAGFAYAYTVMANRPANYYAILEVYAGGFAIAVGLVMIVASLLVRIGVVRLGPPDPNNR